MNRAWDLLDVNNSFFWLLGSLTLAVLATNAAWLLAGRQRRAALPIPEAHAAPAVGWLAQALFCLVPPVLAWRLGILSPYYLGVAEPRWLDTLGVGAPLAAVIVSILVFGWLVYRHTETLVGPVPSAGVRVLAALRAPLDAALLQWHWAFYRAVPIMWLAAGSLPASGPDATPWGAMLLTALGRDPLYWGSWLGMVLVALEYALNPFARARLRIMGRREAALRTIALALATTALFTLTRSFWLCLGCHLVAETIIIGWAPLRAAASRL